MNVVETEQNLQKREYPFCLDALKAGGSRALDVARGERTLVRVCAWCRRAQDSEGTWVQTSNLGRLLATRRVSHGICPRCAARMMARD